MIYKDFIIGLGYVESEMNSVLLWQHEDGFTTAEFAIESIWGCLKKDVEYWKKVYLKKCCETSKGKSSFCGTCGTRIEDDDCDFSKYRNLLYDIYGPIGEINQETIEFFNAAGWEFWPDEFDSKNALRLYNIDRELEELFDEGKIG